MLDTTTPKTLPLANETELLARVAEGDEIAFGALFHHYRTRIYSYAFHLFSNSSLADELVQDVFMKVWLHKDKVRHLLKFDAWLFTIARNQVFDTLKLLAKERSARKQISQLQHTDANVVEDHILTKENERRLQHALSQLSPQQQRIFTLSRHQGMNHEQIASQLNISRNTVKTHLVHALKTLRDILHAHGDSIAIGWLCLHYWLMH